MIRKRLDFKCKMLVFVNYNLTTLPLIYLGYSTICQFSNIYNTFVGIYYHPRFHADGRWGNDNEVLLFSRCIQQSLRITTLQ